MRRPHYIPPGGTRKFIFRTNLTARTIVYNFLNIVEALARRDIGRLINFPRSPRTYLNYINGSCQHSAEWTLAAT